MGAIEDYLRKKRDRDLEMSLKNKDVEKVTSQWLKNSRESELRTTGGKEAPKVNVMGGGGERGG